MSTPLDRVRVEGDRVRVDLPRGVASKHLPGHGRSATGETSPPRVGDATQEELGLRALPEAFVAWQIEDRRRMFDAIAAEEAIAFHASHLPVLCTSPDDGGTPNLANKGIGLLPRDEHLERYVARLERTIEEVRDRPIEETRAVRVAAAREIVDRPQDVDWRRFGLLEIFEGTSYENLRRNPRASLLFTGTAPSYVSFQVDGVVEILREGHPRYRFAWAMRRLFEGERFHVLQSKFPFSYTFWVTGWRDKTPKSRHPHGHGRS